MYDLLTRYGIRPPNQWGNPNYSGREVMENLINQFNAVSPQFTTDPVTGKTIVTKNMPKPYGPPDLDAPYTNLFRSPNNPNWGMDAPFLRSSWVLPPGAMTGPKFIDRSAPTSDLQRQSAFLTGIEGGGGSVSTLNPQTHWPGSSFRVPIRNPEYLDDPYAAPEPMFNSVIDYSTNRYHTPPTPGAWSQSYGPIQGGIPGYGTDMINPVMPTDIDRMLRQSLLRRMSNV